MNLMWESISRKKYYSHIFVIVSGLELVLEFVSRTKFKDSDSIYTSRLMKKSEIPKQGEFFTVGLSKNEALWVLCNT